MKRLRAGLGFTLAELLVVMGIITVLIAILVPALVSARRESLKTICKSHMQQVGYALRMYVDQNADHYPRSPALPSVNPQNWPPLYEMLKSYVGNTMSIFECPADQIIYPMEHISYFYYEELGMWPLSRTSLYAIYHGDVTRIPVIWDADHYHGGNLPFNWLFVDGHVENYLDGQLQ